MVFCYHSGEYARYHFGVIVGVICRFRATECDRPQRESNPKMCHNSRCKPIELISFSSSQQFRGSGRLTKSLNEHQIRSLYDKLAGSKPDERTMFHPTHNFNLQSEIIS